LFLLIGAGLLMSGICMSAILRGRTFRPDENYFNRDFLSRTFPVMAHGDRLPCGSASIFFEVIFTRQFTRDLAKLNLK
jgi:hypothetical protein